MTIFAFPLTLIMSNSALIQMQVIFHQPLVIIVVLLITQLREKLQVNTGEYDQE